MDIFDQEVYKNRIIRLRDNHKGRIGNEVYERNVHDRNKKLKKTKRLQMALVLGAFAAIGPLSIDMYLPSLPALAEGLKS